MTKPTADVLATWEMVSSIAAEHAFEKWIFRGVVNKDYELIPGIGRPNTFRNTDGTPAAYNPKAEQAVIDRFRLESLPYLSIQPRSRVEWLSVAQHHGIPTRLLDWTESVFVAAYFAVKEGGFVTVRDADGKLVTKREDVAIYGTPCPASVGDDPDASAEPVAVYPPHLSPRITVQRGLFTYHSDPTKPYKPPRLEKWTIPSKHCVTLKSILSRVGFNEASLFPDVDGLSRHLSWLTKWGLL